MKPRVLILPFSAAAIIGLVAWRLSWESQTREESGGETTVRRLAPRFELYDQQSRLVKFERYLGRTRLLLLFIGAKASATHPRIRQLVEHHKAFENTGVQIVVVGLATPFANRKAEQQLGTHFPFPVLTDVNMQTPEPAPTHRLWGLAGDDLDDIREGLFLIDRDGTVSWIGAAPQPAADPARSIEAAVRGELP